MRNFRQRYRQPNGPLAARRGSGRALAYPDGVALTGSSGSYIYTADRAALDFSADIEVVMRLKVTDWSTGAIQTLVGRYITGTNNRVFRFYTGATGAPAYTVSTDGTSGTVVTIAIAPIVALPDNTTVWVRMRLDLTNGSNSVATLETSADAGTNTEPSSWTANGSQTGTAIASIFNGTAPLEIGTFANGTLDRLAGRIYRCIVRSGFSGTVIADFNSELSGVGGYTDASGNAWVVN